MDNRPLIAIVDDDAMVAEAIRELVETFGLTGASFDSADAFLNSDLVSRASCLVADIQMPNVDGFELYRRLKRINRFVPVIFITAFPNDRGQRSALEAGAACYLTKPFTPDRLYECLRAAIGPFNGDRTQKPT